MYLKIQMSHLNGSTKVIPVYLSWWICQSHSSLCVVLCKSAKKDCWIIDVVYEFTDFFFRVKSPHRKCLGRCFFAQRKQKVLSPALTPFCSHICNKGNAGKRKLNWDFEILLFIQPIMKHNYGPKASSLSSYKLLPGHLHGISNS